jgi:tetratricopeptide (TPR) repeat protein
MDFFLAEAYAYGSRDQTLALETYESARSTFEALGDDWSQSWIYFYMADLLVDSGDHTKALDLCTAAIDLAEKMPLFKRDPELLGNVYRVRGDIGFHARDYKDAARQYCRASGYAYAFQGIPNPPDEYTAKFYTEITEKIAGKVVHLLACDTSAASDMLAILREYWRPYRCGDGKANGDMGKAAEIRTMGAAVAYLFPVAPSNDEITAKSTAYQVRVRAVVSALTGTP